MWTVVCLLNSSFWRACTLRWFFPPSEMLGESLTAFYWRCAVACGAVYSLCVWCGLFTNTRTHHIGYRRQACTQIIHNRVRSILVKKKSIKIIVIIKTYTLAVLCITCGTDGGKKATDEAIQYWAHKIIRVISTRSIDFRPSPVACFNCWTQ